MLNRNRTLQTLTATTDRLGLGSRSLAYKAGAFNVVATLRTALDHPQWRMDRMRAGLAGGAEIPIPGFPGCPAIPGSPGISGRPQPVGPEVQQVEVVAEQPPALQEVVPADDRCASRRPGQAQRPGSTALRSSTTGFKPVALGRGGSRSQARAAAARAASTRAAAPRAATG